MPKISEKKTVSSTNANAYTKTKESELKINKEKLSDKVGENKGVEQNISILDTLVSITKETEENILKEFIQLMYDNTNCVGGLHDGTLYRELPNTWSCRKDFTEDEQKFKCEGDGDDLYKDCTVRGQINKNKKGNITLVWEFKTIKPESKTVSFYVDKSMKIMSKPAALGYMKNFLATKNDVFIKGNVTIQGDYTGHEDHRGSDHCLIMLPSSSCINLKNPSLDKFIEALYEVKCRKFDKQYELYMKSKVTKDKSGLVITIDLDIGS